MSKDKKKQVGVLGLIVALVVILFGGLLFVGAVSGWFDDKIVLDSEYYGDGTEMRELTAAQYEELVKAQKSFVVLVDQGGCDTADRLREYVIRFMEEEGIRLEKIMFSEMKNTSLHDNVKYYPSVALISKGRVVYYLRADNDEDVDKYNNYEAFKSWMKEHLSLKNNVEK